MPMVPLVVVDQQQGISHQADKTPGMLWMIRILIAASHVLLVHHHQRAIGHHPP